MLEREIGDMKRIKIYSNLTAKSKWKGIIDYKVGGFVIGYVCIVYEVLSALNVSAIYTAYCIGISLIPLFGIYTVLGKEENMSHMLYNIVSYLCRSKDYIYDYEKNKTS